MMTTFLEVDSTFRNRNIYPNASQFTITTNSNVATNAENAFDSVSDAAPTISWFSNMFIRSTLSSVTVNGTTLATAVGYTTSPNTLIFTTAPNQLQIDDDYYKNAVLRTASNGWSRISSYEYLGNDTAKVVLETDLNVPASTAVSISDASDVSRTVLFVPRGDDDDNFYFGQIIHNETLNEWRYVDKYDAKTNLLTVGGNTLTGWMNNHAYSVRKQLPNVVAVLGASTTTNLQINTGLTNIVGSFIRIQLDNVSSLSNAIRRVVSYNSNTGIVVVNPAFPSNPTGLDYEILPFTRDNARSLIYPSGPVPEDSFYTVRLIKLIVPNYVLENKNGGRVSDLPYVYVVFAPINKSFSSLLTTNNINGISAIFIASYENYDVPSSNARAFVHFAGSPDMTQIMKMRIFNDYEFKVFTSDNEPLAFNQSERYSPYAPNPKLQIKALFRFVRR